MYQYPTKDATPRLNIREQNVPLNSSLSPFTESVRSTAKELQGNSRSARKELIQKTLQDKFRNVYESPGKGKFESSRLRNGSQSNLLPPRQGRNREVYQTMGSAVEKVKAQSEASTPSHQDQFNAYSTRSKRMRDLLRRKEVDDNGEKIRSNKASSVRNAGVRSQKSCEAKASERRHDGITESAVMEDRNERRKEAVVAADNGRLRNRLVECKDPRIHSTLPPKSYSEYNFQPDMLQTEKAQKPIYRDINGKVEICLAADKADSIRSQPVQRKLSNVSRGFSECSKCSSCKGKEYVCIGCINESMAKEKQRQRQKERQLNIADDNIQLQRLQDLQRKYIEEVAVLKRSMHDEMKTSLEEAEQRKKRERDEA
eukprot:TRINITY_DN13906_c0_g1_i1.p1 TRINITY_DN13906_c0_g1~~TRINITY_DN13906_c0_g1_i1.p1  ORF type:complete len:371 (-),score=65.51 TRINITY_DN13906_c0_g1_i1:986-2098(-)